MLELTKKRLTNNTFELILRGSAESMAKAEAAIKPFCRAQYQSYVEWNDIFPESSQGSAIQGARYKEDVTQKQLAKKTGLSVKHLSSLENNKEQISIADAKNIAQVLNVNYKIFLTV